MSVISIHPYLYKVFHVLNFSCNAIFCNIFNVKNIVVNAQGGKFVNLLQVILSAKSSISFPDGAYMNDLCFLYVNL